MQMCGHSSDQSGLEAMLMALVSSPLSVFVSTRLHVVRAIQRRCIEAIALHIRLAAKASLHSRGAYVSSIFSRIL